MTTEKLQLDLHFPDSGDELPFTAFDWPLQTGGSIRGVYGRDGNLTVFTPQTDPKVGPHYSRSMSFYDMIVALLEIPTKIEYRRVDVVK